MVRTNQVLILLTLTWYTLHKYCTLELHDCASQRSSYWHVYGTPI